MTTPQPQPSVTSLPRLEDLPQTGEGAYEAEGVREAFEGGRPVAVTPEPEPDEAEPDADQPPVSDEKPPISPEPPTSPEQGKDAS